MIKHQLIEDRHSANLTDFHISQIKNQLDQMSIQLEKYAKQAELIDLVTHQRDKINGFKLALACIGINVTEID